MPEKIKTLQKLLTLACFLCSSLSFANENSPLTCVITPNSVGKIKLGMRLKDIKLVYPNAKLTRTTDGDGVALIAITVNKEDLAIVYAGEENPGIPIQYSKQIEFIETLNPICRTKNGIRPSMSISAAEKILGKVTEITESEIEARQYIRFKNSTNNLNYRIDYCGKFKEGERHTTKYEVGCKLLALSINGL